MQILIHEDIADLPIDHPGVNDLTYRKRRNEIAVISNQFDGNIVPKVVYTDIENDTWRVISEKLAPLHESSASRAYLDAKSKLNIQKDRIPQIADLDIETRAFHDFGLGTVAGIVESAEFLGSLADKRMLCTQYIRHHSKPEYTPEPDIVHEVLGHVPLFTDPDFVEFTELVAKASLASDEEGQKELERLYWFTIEFGLIEEGGNLKVYGAGLLSSFGEIQHCLTPTVKKHEFDLEKVIKQDYDFHRMQDTLFVIPSFKWLMETCRPFLEARIAHKAIEMKKNQLSI